MRYGVSVFVALFSFLFAQPEIAWQRCLGGSGDDYAHSIQQTTDGGYIVAGWTLSDDGDVSGYHGGYDFWVVKLNSSGDIVWQKCLGGSGEDEAHSIQQTTDGGYIVAGVTASNDGDVSGNRGDYDFWVVKLNSSGDIVWQKCLGGSNDDAAYSIQQITDGGYVVAGYTESNDGDVSGNHGYSDSWVVKLSSSGNIVWQKCLGGSRCDNAYSIQQTTDGGYIVAGCTESNDGDVSGNHGGYDFWVVKLNSSGNIVWQKCLGGSSYDEVCSIQQTADGGYIVAGGTLSNDGDVSGNHGSADFWVVKLNSSGDIVWQKCLGGSNDDAAYSIQQITDGGYVVAGYTESNDGDVSGNHGSADFWVVKLRPDADDITEPTAPKRASLSVFPNPFNSSCAIFAPRGSKVSIYAISGKLFFGAEAGEGPLVWTPSADLPCGVYVVRARLPDGVEVTARAVHVR